MRNLKKVLALVLAMAMSLSLAVTAGAAFNDQDKIVNTEAVDMCVALNIINGRTDGSFDPAGNVTRAEMAKMICIVLNGGKEPVTATKATPTFADIDGHWAEGYIEYCYAEGVIAGKSATQFDPNGNVTGTEAAKMLLIALGYNATVEKFVGESWALYTNVKANQDGLYEDLETIDPSAALSRDNAAQMIWNTLNADIILKSSSIENGSIRETYTKQIGTELLQAKYNAETSDAAVLTGYAWDETNEEFDYYFNGAETSSYSSAVDYSGLYAMNVKVVYEKDDSDVYGMFVDESVVLYEGIVADIEAYDADYVKVDGTKFKVDLGTSESASLAVIEAYPVNQYASATNAGAVAGSYSMKVIDLDDNGKIDCITYLPAATAKVLYVGTKSVNLSTNAIATAPTFEDDVIYEGIAKDDYVAIVDSANTAYDGDVVVKLDSVSGTVSATKTNEIQVDGTWYNTTYMNTASEVSSFTLNDEYTLFVSGNYVYFAEEGENNQSLEDLVYVKTTDNGNSIDNGRAKVYFADGTSATITLADSYFQANGTEVENPETYAALNGKLCTFEMDGEDYELTLVDDANALGYDAYDAGAYGVTAKDDNKAGKMGLTTTVEETTTVAATYAIADDAVIFVVEDGDVSVIAGAAAKAYKDAVVGQTGGAVLYEEVSGIDTVKVAVVVTAELPSAAGVVDNYGYVVSDSYTVEINDKDYAVFSIWNGSDIVEVKVELKSGVSAPAEKSFIKYEALEDNVIELQSDLGTVKYAAVKGINGDELALIDSTASNVNVSKTASAGSWYITEDTVVMYVDSEGETGQASGSVQIATEAAMGQYAPNVAYVVDTASDLALLVVEINNEWK